MLRPSLAWPVALALCGCSLTVSLDGLTGAEVSPGAGGIPGSETAGGSAGAPLAGKGGAGSGTGGSGLLGGSAGVASGTAGTGTAGQAGSAPSVVELEGCLHTSAEEIHLGIVPAIVGLGASTKGLAYTFIDGGGNTARVWPGLGSGPQSVNVGLPGGTLSSRLLLNDGSVFGSVDSGTLGSVFGFGFDLSMPCSGGSGVVAPITHFTSCTASAIATPVAIAANTVVVGTACGLQHIAHLNACPTDPGQINVDDPGAPGHAVEIHALALQGGNILYTLEQTKPGEDHLTLMRKEIDFTLTGEFSDVAVVAPFVAGESGADLVLSGPTIYTLVQVESDASSLVASYEAKPSASRTVLARPHRQAEQLAVLGNTVYWVEQTIGKAEIWRQKGTERQRLVCVSNRVASLTVLKEGVFWHDRDVAEGPVIYRVDP